LEDDGADEDVFQRGVGAAVLAEGELFERAIGDGGAQETEKTEACVGLRHGRMGAQARGKGNA